MDERKASLCMVDALELDKTLYHMARRSLLQGWRARRARGTLWHAPVRHLLALLGRYVHGNGALPDGKVLNCVMVICTIQRNARVYSELRDWPWW